MHLAEALELMSQLFVRKPWDCSPILNSPDYDLRMQTIAYPDYFTLVAGASGKVHAANKSPIVFFIVICYGGDEPQVPVEL